jgi:GntR family transcriptional regulator of vanillate catabolism
MESQQTRVLALLREMILRGEFPPGGRLAEIPLSESLKASRTPVKLALATLEQEGLVSASPAGGYVVKTFKATEIFDAIAVRGVLEGMAARLLAEHGLPRQVAQDLKECLRVGERVTGHKKISDEDYSAYIAMNAHFHELIVVGAGNGALQRAIDLNNRLPFAAAGAMLPMQPAMESGESLLRFAQRQHELLFEAIEQGQGSRAQGIAEEHAHISITNLRHALDTGKGAGLLPGMRLVAGTF